MTISRSTALLLVVACGPVVSSFHVYHTPSLGKTAAQRGGSHLKISVEDSWDALTKSVLSSGSVQVPSTSSSSSTAFPVKPSLPELSSFNLDWPRFSGLDAITGSVHLPSSLSNLPDFPNVNLDLLFSDDWLVVLSALSRDLATFYSALPLWLEVIIAGVPVFSFGAATLVALSFPDEDYRSNMDPYPRGEYDPLRARAYYGRHKFLVIQRCLQLFRLSNQFLLSIAIEKYIFRNKESQRPKRAIQLLELITKLGPTSIKAGQA
jgi:hypothetical protein